MSEINNIKPNGFTFASTFTGAGGSCLGFKMAGFEALYANEFIPAAASVYRLNFPDNYLDTRDIRKVSASDIAEVDVMEGSPPCASFSMAGSRTRKWGQEVKYSDTKQRVDDLFFEYIRLIKGVRPKVFIAENVPGLLMGAAKGYFKDILRRMKLAGYVVSCRVVDASFLGIPQSRKRAIFVGVREDLGILPVFPVPELYQYSMRDAIPDIRTRPGEHPDEDITKYAIGNEWDAMPPGSNSAKFFKLKKPQINRPCNAILQTIGITGLPGVCHPYQKRKLSIYEIKRLQTFPDDFRLEGTFAQQCERLGRSVPPVMMSKIAGAVALKILGRI